MKAFTKLALKNVFRNKRRTIITLGIIIFGMMSLFFTYGFINFSFQGLREQTIRQGIGHLQIFNPDFYEKVEDHVLEYGIENPDSLIREMIFDKDIRFSMKRIEFQGLISNGDKSDIFLGRGIQPRLEEKLSSVFVKMEKGRLLSQANDDDFQVIIGKGLAKNLKTKIGEYLTVLSSTTYGAQNAIDLKLVGIFSTGIPQLDARLIMVDLSAAQILLDTKKVSKVVVVLKESLQTERKINELSALFPGYKLRSWKQLAPFYRGVVNLYTSAFGLLSFIIIFIAVLAVSNTMVMSISERTQEIGTLLAIGTPQKRLLNNFIIEGFSVGLIGAILSIILGLIVITAVNKAGFRMPPPPGSTSGYPLFINILPLMWLKIAAGMIIISITSTILPALKASRMNIVNALGHI
jgi:putative ABC transport system permease protein